MTQDEMNCNEISDFMDREMDREVNKLLEEELTRDMEFQELENSFDSNCTGYYPEAGSIPRTNERVGSTNNIARSNNIARFNNSNHGSNIVNRPIFPGDRRRRCVHMGNCRYLSSGRQCHFGHTVEEIHSANV